MLNSIEHDFFLLINVKMPTIVGILTFMSRKNSILGLFESEKRWNSWYFYTNKHLKFPSQLSWAWKKFYNIGPCLSLNCIRNKVFIAVSLLLWTYKPLMQPSIKGKKFCLYGTYMYFCSESWPKWKEIQKDRVAFPAVISFNLKFFLGLILRGS